ncbi:GNAT family N-acetyltransferase [Candidatus Zixiibacteriota bacterium]
MLKGQQIYLRLLEESDLPLRVKWINTDEIRSTLMFDYPLSIAKTRQWFSNTLMDSTKVHFSIVDNESEKVIGMTGFIDINVKHQRSQFYITIGETEFWGRGIADEVLKIVLWYGFVELNLNKIYLYTLRNNERARKVYERNGFIEEGVLRQHYYCVGEMQDLHQHSILKSDWLAITSRYDPEH